MRRFPRVLLLSAVALALVGLVSTSTALARTSPGLGVFTGAKLHPGGDLDLEYNLGFFVDLPLINTFFICPTADTYEIGDVAVTDLALYFKFVLPFGTFRPYAAVAPGLTTIGNERDLHLAGALGTYIHLVQNIDLLLQAEYKKMMDPMDDERLESGSVLLQGGMLFRF